MESKYIMSEVQKEFEAAKAEIGEEEYNEHLCFKFGKPVLNYVKTLVINLPGSCYANCSYCIDSCLRKSITSTEKFLEVCKIAFEEFEDIKEVSITGGSLPAAAFNVLVNMIDKYYPGVKITWNTNGIMLDDDYDVSKIKYINLHRNSIDEDENKAVFKTTKPILSIDEAKRMFGSRLCIRVTVDENFNLDDYLSFNTPVYINKMLPGNDATNAVFENVLSSLNISDNVDIRRRNQYLNCTYKGMSVRVCMGDKMATRVPGRYPVFLNVAIIHRSGKICGSWYEDDKLLY